MALLLNLIHVLKGFPYLLSGSKSTLLSYSLSNWPFSCSQPDMSWSYWASLPHLPNSFYWAFQVSFKQTASLHPPVYPLSGFRIFSGKSNSSLRLILSLCSIQPALPASTRCSTIVCNPSDAFFIVLKRLWPTPSALLDDGDQV